MVTVTTNQTRFPLYTVNKIRVARVEGPGQRKAAKERQYLHPPRSGFSNVKYPPKTMPSNRTKRRDARAGISYFKLQSDVFHVGEGVEARCVESTAIGGHFVESALPIGNQNGPSKYPRDFIHSDKRPTRLFLDSSFFLISPTGFSSFVARTVECRGVVYPSLPLFRLQLLY